jgi:hypothetical protein
MIRAQIFVQWLGPFPPWMPCFLASCARIRTVRWLIFHDAPPPANPAANVEFVPLAGEAFRERARTRLGVEPPPALGYKLCDFKATYGTLFGDFLGDTEYFGWTDLDLVYGDVDRLLAPLLGTPDVLSFHRGLLSNHFCLMRNDQEHRQLYQRIPGWREKLAAPGYSALDDEHLTNLVRGRARTYSVEHYTTPFVNWMPWTDGTYSFPHQWRWNRGQVTNNLDVGYEFLYFHFMVWKGGRKPYYSAVRNWEGLPPSALGEGWRGEAFTLDETGIASARPRASVPLRPMTDLAPPRRTLLRRLRIKLQYWPATRRLMGA